MEPIVNSPFFWAGLVVSVITASFWFGNWRGAVNTDRDSFKEFMREVRSDIKKILLKLSDPVTDRSSPIRLTELGRKISNEIDAKSIAKGLLSNALSEVNNESAYDIQEYCFTHLNDCELSLSDTQVDQIKQCAFDNGIETLSVRRVIAIELRDMILSKLSLELK